MTDVFNVASYFVKASFDDRIKISHIKLQKLLYFAQGIYLANTDGKPLFKDKIYAWEFGPVVKTVYRSKYRFFGNNKIDPLTAPMIIGLHRIHQWQKLDFEIQDFLFSVWNLFKKYQAFELVELTHAPNSPWYDIFIKYERKGQKIPRDTEISTRAMTDYFKSFLINGPE